MAEGSRIDEPRAPVARQAPDVGDRGIGVILARYGDEGLARHQHRRGGKALQPPAFGKACQIGRGDEQCARNPGARDAAASAKPCAKAWQPRLCAAISTGALSAAIAFAIARTQRAWAGFVPVANEDTRG